MSTLTDGRHDFDFLHGRWRVRNERLRQRLVGSDDWEVFEATQECRPLLDGLGNADDFSTAWQGGYRGMALRLFDERARIWRIYWTGSPDAVLDPPVLGRFDQGVGTFVTAIQHEGRSILMKFVWDQIGANAAHWHQEFSTDDGQSWETNWHMWLRRVDELDRLVHDDAVIELRQYITQPGHRDTLIELFEREFVEPQEAVGMHLIGTFRNLDAPDRFVWLRGFADMPARKQALESFYNGRLWQQHRAAANATLLDNDDVLLLQPARPGSGLAPAAGARPQAGEEGDAGAYVIGICSLEPATADDFAARFERVLAPRLFATGADVSGTYVTDPSENTFPRLPVREGERVFVWFARFADAAAQQRHLDLLREDGLWREAIADALLGELKSPPQLLRLAPTARSQLR